MCIRIMLIKLSLVADHNYCTDQPTATSLAYACCPLCCSALLFTHAFTCMLSLYAKPHYNYTREVLAFVYQPPFSSFLQCLQLKEREKALREQGGGKRGHCVSDTHSTVVL